MPVGTHALFTLSFPFCRKGFAFSRRLSTLTGGSGQEARHTWGLAALQKPSLLLPSPCGAQTRHSFPVLTHSLETCPVFSRRIFFPPKQSPILRTVVCVSLALMSGVYISAKTHFQSAF
eukprot:EG_transcript_40945